MFRTACIFVALALCAATAPPRISLELADGAFNAASETRSHNRVDAVYDSVRTANSNDSVTNPERNHKDLSQFCEANNNAGANLGAACKFPIAKAYDHLDGDISDSMTETYTLVDSDKEVPTNTVATCCDDLANPSDCDCKNLDDLTNPETGNAAIKTRSTYLFTYDVKDKVGNDAEQVTFALIINDEIKPTIHNSATDAWTGAGTDADGIPTGPRSTTLESGHSNQFKGHSEFTCTDPNLVDDFTVDTGMTQSPLASTHKPWAEMTDNDKICNHTLTTIGTCTDKAGWYGADGINGNFRTMSVTTVYTDTTPPTLTYDLPYTLDCASTADETGLGFSSCNDVGDNLPSSYTADLDITENTEAIFFGYFFRDSGSADGLYGSAPSDTSDNTGDVTITQKCTDKCGNFVEVDRTITVQDVTPPAIQDSYVDNIGSIDTDCASVTAGSTTSCHAHSVTTDVSDITTRTFHIVPNTVESAAWDAKCKPTTDNHHVDTATHDSVTCATANYMEPDSGEHGGISEAYVCDSDSCTLDETTADANHDHDTTFAWHARERFSDTCCLRSAQAVGSTMTGSEISESWGSTPFLPGVTGTYTRTFTVSDCTGNTKSVGIVVTLQDPDAPVIHMEGCEANHATCMNHEEGSNTVEYTDYGAQCHDYVDGVLSHAVEVSGMVVNMRVVGTYLINYDCADLSGNAATPAQRTVIVQDTTPPVCLFDTAREQGVNMNFVEAGFPYVDAGVTMSDSLDGECVEGLSSNGADVQCNGPPESPTEGHGTITVEGNTVTTGEVFYRFNSCDSIRRVQSMPANGGTMPANGQYIITPTGTSVRVLVNCYFTGSSDSAPAVTFLVYFGNDFANGPALGHCPNVLGTHAVRMVGDASSVNHAALLTSLDFATRANAAELATQVLDTTGDGQQSLENACAIYNTTDVQVPDGSTTITNDVTHAEPGVYRITFDGKDRVGNMCPRIIRTVIVRDTLPPIISLVHPLDTSDTVFQHNQTENSAVGLSGQTNWDTPGGAAHHKFMAETSSVNGWFIGAVACAVSGVALLATSMKKAATSVPV